MDVYFLKDLDPPFFDFIRQYDVSYIWRVLNSQRGHTVRGLQQDDGPRREGRGGVGSGAVRSPDSHCPLWRPPALPDSQYQQGRMQAETGMVVYQANAQARNLLDRILQYYRKPADYEECMDDTCVFSRTVVAMVEDGNLRDSHFAVCAHRWGTLLAQGRRCCTCPAPSC